VDKAFYDDNLKKANLEAICHTGDDKFHAVDICATISDHGTRSPCGGHSSGRMRGRASLHPAAALV
jgi:hypothetical protein